MLASFLTTSLLTTSALSPTISTHSRSPLKSPFYVPQYACLQPMSCCLAPFSLSVRLSCPSVLTLSPWLSSCDTWRCPTVHWCSHLSHLRMARYLFHLIPHFSFGVSDFWSFFLFYLHLFVSEEEMPRKTLMIGFAVMKIAGGDDDSSFVANNFSPNHILS